MSSAFERDIVYSTKMTSSEKKPRQKVVDWKRTIREIRQKDDYFTLRQLQIGKDLFRDRLAGHISSLIHDYQNGKTRDSKPTIFSDLRILSLDRGIGPESDLLIIDPERKSQPKKIQHLTLLRHFGKELYTKVIDFAEREKGYSIRLNPDETNYVIDLSE